MSTDKMQEEDNSPLEVAIVGAGFSGICMAIKLRQAGITRFKIFEKTGGISGTWYDNTYPGAACDVPSHLYCFSFELNPDWSRVFSPQPEIQAYTETCVDKYKIRPHVRFHCEIKGASFNEEKALWTIENKEGEKIQARVLVSAIGALNRPLIPDIEGLSDFSGDVFHSAQWNHDCDLKGKRVGVIGSAASAIQIIPAIAPEVKKLHVFQRTPNYIVRRNNRDYSEKEKKRFRRFPFLLRILRWAIYWFMESRFIAFKKGSKIGAFQAKRTIKSMCEQIPDPELQKKLIPNYPLGCKRVLLSDDYFPALNRDNVELITEGIEKITPNGILTKEGKTCEVDVIVLATGFQVADLLGPIDIQGRGGQPLSEAWKEGVKTHWGLTVTGYPNFFFLLGPNTGLGHNSIIFMIEAQVNYVMKCLKKLSQKKSIDVKKSAMETFDKALQKGLEKTVWAADCDSWYKTKDGKITTLWAHCTLAYWWALRKPKFSDYDIETYDIETESKRI